MWASGSDECSSQHAGALRDMLDEPPNAVVSARVSVFCACECVWVCVREEKRKSVFVYGGE